ncbi:MAG TPA: DUF4123 domain-containing protein [Polyangiaceae bacterium]|jgi:hypothetical protein
MNEMCRTMVETLWSADERVYAVLDGARDPLVFMMVRACGLPHACLYAGRIPPELAKVAPYVVEVRRDHPFLEALLERGWGKSWGVFATAPCDLEAMRRHLRHFLRVQREDGKTMVFRYYDPRVLRVYLPTCTEAELTTFFGPVSRFVLEDGGDGSRAVVFARGGGAWSTSKVALQSDAPRVAVEVSPEM